MRLLLTGAAGMLGRDLGAAAERAGHDVTGLTRDDLDIRDAAAVRAAIAAAAPDAVVNCAAWTDVDGAEEHEADATLLNGAAAGHVAAAAAAAGRVHRADLERLRVRRDGDRAVHRVARDRAARRLRALQARGRARRRRRRARRARDRPDRLAVRPPRRQLRRHHAAARRASATRISVVDDQIGCPTFTGHLADALVAIAERRLGGVRHVAGAGACSWHDLAAADFAATGASVALERGRTADLGRPAPRPAFSVLRSERPDTPVLPPWQDGLTAYLELGVTA